MTNKQVSFVMTKEHTTKQTTRFTMEIPLVSFAMTKKQISFSITNRQKDQYPRQLFVFFGRGKPSNLSHSCQVVKLPSQLEPITVRYALSPRYYVLMYPTFSLNRRIWISNQTFKGMYCPDEYLMV